VRSAFAISDGRKLRYDCSNVRGVRVVTTLVPPGIATVTLLVSTESTVSRVVS